MHHLRSLLVAAGCALMLCSTGVAQKGVPSMKSAESLIKRQKWSQAAEAYAKIAAADPENAEAWFQLGFARHGLEDWDGAAEANERAAKFPVYRATALYNAACARSLGGQLEEAQTLLAEAVDAGFLDLDLMASDADLEALRAEGSLELPPVRSYRELKARNKLLMKYAVIEPKGFDPEQAYPVLVAFAPGTGTRSADWMMQELWSGAADQERWIVVTLVAPEEKGWFTHPSHHALEDVLRSLQKEYEVAGDKFHLFGFATSCSPALTYSGMSKKYFQSMTLVSSSAWSNYDDSDMKRWKRMPVHQIVGATSFTLDEDQGAHERLKAQGVQSSLTVVPDNGLLVESMRGRALLDEIAAAQFGK